MSFLLGAFLLIVLLLPGVMFRVGYLSVPFNSKSFRSSFLEELLFSLVPAFVLQTAGYLITERCFHNVDEHSIYLLLINSDKVARSAVVAGSIGRFAAYMVLVTLGAVGLGAGLRTLSKRLGWHLRYPVLRIYNEWQIYFDGIVLDRPDVPGSSGDVDLVYADVLVEANGVGYIYSGVLEDYVVDREEKLDRLYLTLVRRRKLADDRSAAELRNLDYRAATDAHDAEEPLDERYYAMPGRYFIIPGAQIRNINIFYKTFEEEPAS